MVRLLACLGNPGKDYEKTRHNAGWIFADYLCDTLGAAWTSSFQGALMSLKMGPDTLYVYRPGSFMNLSGQGVRKICDFYKISIKNLIVAHDDLELSLGTYQIRKGGGARGHNGLRSIDQYLGNKDYYRLGLGIGRPKHGDVSSYVLGRFAPSEESELSFLFPKIWQDILTWISESSSSSN